MLIISKFFMPILFTFKPRVHKIFFDKKDSWIKKKG